MKLAYQQLAQHVTKSLAPIYLLSGDEVLLVTEAVDLIRSAAQKAGFAEHVRVQAEGVDWGQTLHTHLHSRSLFASKRLIELDLRGLKFNQANSDILSQYAENFDADTLLLMHADKLDKKTEQTRWYKSIEKNGVTIAIWPIPAAQLPQWIIQRAKNLNLNFSPSAATWLAEQVEGNLLAAAQEIEKLYLYQPDRVDEALLTEIVMDHTQFDIFNLVDSMLLGNNKRSLRILKNLFATNIEPTLILWAITRELRMLADFKKQIEQGNSLATLFSQFRIFEKRQPAVRAFLKRATRAQCMEWLLQAGQIDRIIKGAALGNVENEFERLVLGLSSRT